MSSATLCMSLVRFVHRIYTVLLKKDKMAFFVHGTAMTMLSKEGAFQNLKFSPEKNNNLNAEN